MLGAYLGSKLNTIDTLTEAATASQVKSSPRSLQKHFKYLEASELRTWLQFYSLSLLHNNLPSLFFHHYALGVCHAYFVARPDYFSSGRWKLFKHSTCQ